MKKIIAAVMASALVASPIAAVAAENPVEEVVTAPYSTYSEGKANEPTTAELEQMIKIVKPKLNVPEECTEFDWDYDAATYHNQATWYMTWFDPDYTKEVSVSCDNNGNIISHFTSRYDIDRTAQLPKFKKADLEKTACDFLAKLAPDAASHMRLTDSYSTGIYSRSYMYYFVRYENDVIVPDNTAYVLVDYVTGEPVSFDITYNRYVSFDGEKTIEADSAKDLLAENQNMKLSYRLKTEYDDDGKMTGRKAYLVYTPEVSYLSVDAKTSNVYTERNTWNVLEKGMASGSTNGIFGSMMDATAKEESAESEYRLSEQELAQLEVLENLITREEAINIITKNEYLFIDPAATAVEAQLNQYHSYEVAGSEEKDKDDYQWNITLTAPYQSSKENGYYSPRINATVDAKTGAIISFSASTPGYSYYKNATNAPAIPELKFTEDEASDIFTQFATTVVPEYVQNSRKTEGYNSGVIDYIETDNDETIPVYRILGVNLTRVNEGVDFTFNGVDGAVDLVTGKVTSFSYNWYDDVVFESPKDAITPEEAYRVLLDSEGFGLNYEINSNYTYHKYLEDESKGYIDYDKLYTTEQYTRLVYSGYNYVSTTVGALSGKIIDYSGEPVTATSDSAYTDIEGHWAKEDIDVLTDLGFSFSAEETEFKPDSYITLGEFEQLMHFFNKYFYESVESTDDRTAIITRSAAVKHIIDACGYYKIAAMPDIFITDFADNSSLNREDVGFIAIAKGMGFIQGNLGEFRPYDSLTRAEAVTMVLNFIENFN